MNEKLKKLMEEARKKMFSDPLRGGEYARFHIRSQKSKAERSGSDERYFFVIDDLSAKDTRWKKIIIKAIGDFYLPSQGDIDLLRGFARENDWEISHQAAKVLGNFCHKSELARRTVKEMVLDDFQTENIHGAKALRASGVKAPDFVIETVKESLEHFHTLKKQSKYQHMRYVLRALDLIEIESAAEAALEVVLQYLDHPQLGVTAAEAMGGLAVCLPDEKALNHIRAMARNKNDESERAKAAVALWSIASLQLKRVREDLAQLLEEETSEWVLYHAYRALWWYADRETDWALNTVSEKMPLLQSEGSISVVFGILKKAAYRTPRKVYELSRTFSLPETGRIRALYPLILWGCADDVFECREQLKEMIHDKTPEEGLIACLAMTDFLRSDREGNLSDALKIRIRGEGELLLFDYSDFFRKYLDIVLESEYRDIIVKHLFSALSSNPYPVVSDLCECIGLIASRDDEVFSKVLSFDQHQFMMLRPCAATRPGDCEEALRIYAQHPVKELQTTCSAVELMVEIATYNPEWPFLNTEIVRGNSSFEGTAEVFAKVYSASFDAKPKNCLEGLDQLVDDEFDPNFFYFWQRLARHRLPVAFSAFYGRTFEPKPINQKEAITLCEHFQWAVKQTPESFMRDEILLIYDTILSILVEKESVDWKSLCTKLRQAEFTDSRLGWIRKEVATAIANAFETLETGILREQFQEAIVDIRDRLLLNPYSFLESYDTRVKEGTLHWNVSIMTEVPLERSSYYTLMYLPEVRLATIALNKIMGLEEDTCAVEVGNRMKFNKDEH